MHSVSDPPRSLRDTDWADSSSTAMVHWRNKAQSTFTQSIVALAELVRLAEFFTVDFARHRVCAFVAAVIQLPLCRVWTHLQPRVYFDAARSHIAHSARPIAAIPGAIRWEICQPERVRSIYQAAVSEGERLCAALTIQRVWRGYVRAKANAQSTQQVAGRQSHDFAELAISSPSPVASTSATPSSPVSDVSTCTNDSIPPSERLRIGNTQDCDITPAGLQNLSEFREFLSCIDSYSTKDFKANRPQAFNRFEELKQRATVIKCLLTQPEQAILQDILCNCSEIFDLGVIPFRNNRVRKEISTGIYTNELPVIIRQVFYYTIARIHQSSNSRWRKVLRIEREVRNKRLIPKARNPKFYEESCRLDILVIHVKGEIKRSFAKRGIDLIFPPNDSRSVWRTLIRAKVSLSKEAGNCGEMAAVVFVLLMELSNVRRIDYFTLTEGDHAFVVIGNNQNLTSDDIIIDPHMQLIYPISEIQMRMRGLEGVFPLDLGINNGSLTLRAQVFK